MSERYEAERAETGSATGERQALDALHARLLEGDVTAPSELAVTVLPPLERLLRRRDGKLFEAAGATVRDDALHDAAIDAWISLVKRPEQYDPKRAPGGLLPFLLMAAHHDLLNMRPKIERQRQVVSLSFVELESEGRNINMTLVGGASRAAAEAERPIDEEALTMKLLHMETEAERSVLRHMEAGERRTSVFAADLGITSLPAHEQRREVKRAKDKIKKRLERAGLTWRP